MKPATLRDADLRLHQVDAGDHLRHGMLDLNARIHLDEVPLASVDVVKKLDGAGVAVVRLARDAQRSFAQFAAYSRGQICSWRDFHDLLVAPLDGAIAFPEVQQIAVVVGKDLHFDVPRARKKLLQEDGGIAKCRARFALRFFDFGIKLRGIVNDTHATPAAAPGCLHNDRITNFARDSLSLAASAGVPVLPGTEVPVKSASETQRIAREIGYPIIVKAARGGGGRGMRVVHDAAQLDAKVEEAQGEARSAFGDASVFLEKFLPRARHIEVQILADHHGNLLHLWERDCSVQRRHQKVVEVAPAANLPAAVRNELCEAALRIARKANYRNAGTVEFLYDVDAGKWYFIEVNPRIQVEHTVTEMVTGIDLVQ